MSSKIDPCEVLSYLNHLGYKNIDASQLQAFIIDLKRLMKYERKSNEAYLIEDLKQEQKYESISEENNIQVISPSSLTEIDLKIHRSRRPLIEPIRSSLEATSNSTVICPVHSYKCSNSSHLEYKGTKCTCTQDVESVVSTPSTKNDKTSVEVYPPLKSKTERNSGDSNHNSPGNRIHTSTTSSIAKKTKKAVDSKNCTHDFTHPCHCPKPKSSVIKCNIGSKPSFPKCDPVNLHKYYQRQWKINKIPGENISREQRFRWCFREKILGGPPVKN